MFFNRLGNGDSAGSALVGAAFDLVGISDATAAFCNYDFASGKHLGMTGNDRAGAGGRSLATAVTMIFGGRTFKAGQNTGASARCWASGGSVCFVAGTQVALDEAQDEALAAGDDLLPADEEWDVSGLARTGLAAMCVTIGIGGLALAHRRARRRQLEEVDSVFANLNAQTSSDWERDDWETAETEFAEDEAELEYAA
jgi:hypothetical protein